MNNVLGSEMAFHTVDWVSPLLQQGPITLSVLNFGNICVSIIQRTAHLRRKITRRYQKKRVKFKYKYAMNERQNRPRRPSRPSSPAAMYGAPRTQK